MTRAQAILYCRAATWAEPTNRTPGQLHAYLTALNVAAELAPEEAGLDAAISVLEGVFDLSPVKRQQACHELTRAAMPHRNRPD